MDAPTTKRFKALTVIAAALILPLFAGGCATQNTGAGLGYASQAKEAALATIQCGAAKGVTVESAQAKKDAGEQLTNDENAVLQADKAMKDAEILKVRLESAQSGLDSLATSQGEVTSELDRLKPLQETYLGKMRFFYKRFTELGSISKALEQVTGGDEYPVETNELNPKVRHFLEGSAVPLATAAGFVGGPLALGIWIGDVLGTGVAESRLRDLQKRTVADLLGVLQELKPLLEEMGLENYAESLIGPISSGQTYMGQVNNSDRELKPIPMIKDMGKALENLLSGADTMATRIESKETELDGIAQRTSGAFATQKEIVADLAHARDRARAAKRACDGHDSQNPFSSIHNVPGWNTTFWDISSP